MSKIVWILVGVTILGVATATVLLTQNRVPAPQPQPQSQQKEARQRAKIEKLDIEKNALLVLYSNPAFAKSVTISLTGQTKYYFYKPGGNPEYQQATVDSLVPGITIELETNPSFDARVPDRPLVALNIFIVQ